VRWQVYAARVTGPSKLWDSSSPPSRRAIANPAPARTCGPGADALRSFADSVFLATSRPSARGWAAQNTRSGSRGEHRQPTPWAALPLPSPPGE